MLMSEVEIVKEDWKTILEQEEAFPDKFYNHLFQLDPDLKCLFKRSMRMQGRKVVSMFDTAIQKLDQPLMMLPPLLAAGNRHLQYNVKMEHYATMCDAFIRTIAEILGERFSDERAKAWQQAFNMITQIMLNGHAQAAEQQESLSERVGG